MKSLMTFEEAFDAYILNQKIISWGFQQPARVKLRNGYDAFQCGYFTEYGNGYKLIVSGAALGKTAVQEAMILDPQGVPVARDTEDIDPKGYENNFKHKEKRKNH